MKNLFFGFVALCVLSITASSCSKSSDCIDCSKSTTLAATYGGTYCESTYTSAGLTHDQWTAAKAGFISLGCTQK